MFIEDPRYKFACGNVVSFADIEINPRTRVKHCPVCGETKAVKVFTCRYCGEEIERFKGSALVVACKLKECKAAYKKEFAELKAAGKSFKDEYPGTPMLEDLYIGKDQESKKQATSSADTWNCVHREACLDTLWDTKQTHLNCHGCPKYEKETLHLEDFMRATDPVQKNIYTIFGE